MYGYFEQANPNMFHFKATSFASQICWGFDNKYKLQIINKTKKNRPTRNLFFWVGDFT